MVFVAPGGSLTEPEKNYYDLMESMFSSGWTSGSSLFLGAKECADYVVENGGDRGPALNTNTMAPRCISNIQVCVWDKDCGLTDSSCEYTGEYGWDGCRAQSDFLQESCPDAQVDSVKVPSSYLGQLDTANDPELIVCS